jgi:hypothetical protein
VALGDFAVKINEVITESLYDTLAKVGQARRRAAYVRPDATGTSPAAQYAAQLRAQEIAQRTARQAQQQARTPPQTTPAADQFLSQFKVNPKSRTVTFGKQAFKRDAGDNWVNALNGRKVPADIVQYLDMVSPLPTGFRQFPNQPIPKVRQPTATPAATAPGSGWQPLPLPTVDFSKNPGAPAPAVVKPNPARTPRPAVLKPNPARARE